MALAAGAMVPAFGPPFSSQFMSRGASQLCSSFRWLVACQTAFQVGSSPVLPSQAAGTGGVPNLHCHVLPRAHDMGVAQPQRVTNLLKTQLFNFLGNMGYMSVQRLTSPGLGVLRGKVRVTQV